MAFVSTDDEINLTWGLLRKRFGNVEKTIMR